MTEAPSIAIAAPMTADEVRLELLVQVLILGSDAPDDDPIPFGPVMGEVL